MDDAVSTLKQLSYFSRVSLAHRYLCLTVPKVGCTTVKRTLHEWEGIKVDESAEVHTTGEELRAGAHPDEDLERMLTDEAFLRFCFVRNPYDRVFSAWKSKIASNDPQFGWVRNYARTMFQLAGDEPVSFEHFVLAIVDGDDLDVRNESHWLPQCEITRPDQISYDIVGRFETFTHDFQEILGMLQAPPRIKQIAAEVTNPTAALPLQDFYTQSLAGLVYRKYESGFDMFGYARSSWKR